MLKFPTLTLLALIPVAACAGTAAENGGEGGGDQNGGSGATAGVAGTGQGGSQGGAAPQGGSPPTGGVSTGGVAPTGGASGVAGTPPTGGVSGTTPTGGVSGTGVTGGTAGGPGGSAGALGGQGGTGGSSAGAGTGPGGTAGAAGMAVNCPAAPANTLIGWATQGGTTTGGGNGTPVTVTSASASQITDNTARVVQFTTLSGTVNVGSNKTLQGMGSTATINGKIDIDGKSNIILRNFRLNASSSSDDGMTIQGGSNHIWIDHLEIYDAEDGNMDIVDGSDYITVSWTKFRYSSTGDHNFSNLIASDDSDSGNYRVTFHHNWWANNVLERMPRVRFGQVHVFNNYYGTGTGTGAPSNDHCVRAAHEADVRVESNFFERVETPHEIAEDNGTAVMTATTCANNTSVGSPAGCNIELLSLNTGGNPAARGTAFTPAYQYASSMTVADCVKAHVTNASTGAGPH